MRVQKLFDLPRVEILAATDHRILDAADDVTVALVVDRADVAGVHPAFAVHRFRSSLRIVPVADHHRIAPCADFARRAARYRSAVLINNLGLEVRLNPTDR